MFKKILFAGSLMIAVSSLAGTIRTDLELSEVRQPVKLREILNSNFETLAGGTNLPAGAVTKSSSVTTNISAAAYVTNATASVAFTLATVAVTNASGTVSACVTGVTGTVTMTLQKATPVAQNASIIFVQGCATNAP